MGSYDPEVEAAFGNAAPAAAAAHQYDPEVNAAFGADETSTSPPLTTAEQFGYAAKGAYKEGLSQAKALAIELTPGVREIYHGMHPTPPVDLKKIGDAIRHPYDTARGAMVDWMEQAHVPIPGMDTAPKTPQEAEGRGGAVLRGAENVAGVPSLIGGVAKAGAGLVSRAAPALEREAIAPLTHGPAAGASGAAIDLSKAPPELHAEIVAAQQKGPVNQRALERQLDATTLPMPEGESPLHLRRSSALGEAQGHGDEYNMQGDPDTEGLLKNAIVGEDRKLAGSMGEIQRRANPDIVHMATDEHAQSAIRSVKELDNSRLTDIRGKYKAVADANGGNMPVDMGEAATTADSSLKKNYLSKLTDDHPVLGPIMERLRSGEPMTFEDWESGTKALSEVQRRGGSEARAAGIIRDQYENMPLAPEAAGLRGMLNDAKTAYKARMDDIENVPAYKAVVEDNVPMQNGLHDLNARSPLSESYLKQYMTGTGKTASRAYVERMQALMRGNPEFSQHIEAGTLNTLRDAAGVDEGGEAARGFKNAGYERALANLKTKSDLLMRPEVQGHVEQLGRVAGYVKDAPAGTVANRSGTALALIRHGAMYGADPSLMSEVASHVGTMAAGKVAGPAGVLAKQYIEGRFRGAKEAAIKQSQAQAKLKYAQEATKPGAGISYEPPPGSNP